MKLPMNVFIFNPVGLLALAHPLNKGGNWLRKDNMENFNDIDFIAKLAGLPPKVEKDAGSEFMDRWREDHKKQSNEPMFTGD